MALNIPKVVSSFLAENDATQRLISGLTNAVNPIASFLNSTFATDTDGALGIVRRIKNFTADQINAAYASLGALDVSGRVNANGDLYANKRVIANTGFKMYVPLGYYYNSSYTVGTGYVQSVVYTVSTSGTAYQAPNFIQMPFAGSVVGISALYYGQAAAIGCNVQIRGINTVPTYSFTSPGQPYAAAIAYARGVYSFSAFQNLQAFISFNNAGNNLLSVGAVVELDV